MPDMLALYYSPGACSLASHIALEDSGATYTAHRVDFQSAEQKSADYLAVNPKARVPALLTSRGVLTETPAILAYIAQSFPQAKLAPLDDPFGFAEVQSFNNYLCATVHVAHAHGPRASRWVDDPAAILAVQKKVPETVGACFDLIENQMLKGPWVMGEAYTVADPYLFTIARWLERDGVDLTRIPKVVEHRARMADRTSVRKALTDEGSI
jgi:glutathione S-transferase